MLTLFQRQDDIFLFSSNSKPPQTDNKEVFATIIGLKEKCREANLMQMSSKWGILGDSK